MSAGQREDVQADGQDARYKRWEQHLVVGRDLVRVGVSGEVLAPAAAIGVVAQAAVQQASVVGRRAGRSA